MDFTLYTTAGVAIIILLLLFWIVRLEKKLRKLLECRKGTLDDAFDHLRKEVESLKKYSENATEKFQTIDNKLKKTISGNETVRFNPFKGTGSGSNQSFATALINSEGDGVILSSLYSRDHVSIFSKPVKKLTSEYELTAEERMALQKAKESIR
ncbi:MAG: DUF4446 family protein [Candidatus Pacebacteria bacterium]|nr:DUF4446 family protein [Candidatus Paceibacterota bacterium]